MKVFRIEDQEGLGPFRGSINRYLEAAARHDGPWIWKSKEIKNQVFVKLKENWIFGFNTEEILFYVFDLDFNELAQHKYVLATYEASDFLIGEEGQVVFNRTTATLLSSIPF